MNAGDVFVAVSEQLRSRGFVPTERESTVDPVPGLTLFSAVRRANGMNPDDAVVCYWNWQELRSRLLEVWQVLDAEATLAAGQPTTAFAWAAPKTRTLDEVLTLLAAASASSRGTISPLSAAKRPRARGIGRPNRPRAVLASMLAVLHTSWGLPMTSVISQVLLDVPSRVSDEQLLIHLDSLIAQTGQRPRCGSSEIPKVLARHYSQLRDDEEQAWTGTFGDYLAMLIEEHAPEDDNDLLTWLKQHSPDPLPPVQPKETTSPRRSEAKPEQAFTGAPAENIGAMRTFAAIDVETANPNRGSICSIGVAVVMDGQVTERRHWLVQPPEGLGQFAPFNVSIHGIRAKDVQDAPTFADAMSQVTKLLGDLPVVAHNAAFDIGAIRQACLASGALVPSLYYSCTMALARASLRLPTYSLPWCAAHFEIALDKHHDALADAEACANLALALIAEGQVDGLDSLLEKSRLRWGRLSEVEWLRARLLQPGTKTPAANPAADPLHPLYGAAVAITGDLVAVTRQQAFDRLADLGAICQRNVTQTTQFLVVGDLSPGTLRPGAEISGKMRKAFELQADGQKIEVIAGYDFLAMIE